MDWNDLRYFLAISEEGSLSAAARKLKISQPTLSRRLSALEDSLGNSLFARTKGGLQLTALGQQLLPSIRAMREDAFAVERLSSGDDSRTAGRVIVTAPGTLGDDWLVRRLPGFLARYPKILVHVQVDAAVADLLRREADIAMRMFRPAQADLIASKAADVGWGLYASERYMREFGPFEGFGDIPAHRFVVPSQDMLTMSDASLFRALPIRDRIVMRTNNMAGLGLAMREGLGIGALPCFQGDSMPGLCRLMPETLIAKGELWLVAHAELRRNARVRLLYDYLKETLAGEAPLFLGGSADTVLLKTAK